MTQSVIRTLNTTDVELHNIAKTIPDEAASAGISMMLFEAEHVRITETCQAELSEPASRVFCRVV